jgi:hypothetical protein
MEDERDLVVITDDEGVEYTMEVLDYFFYEGQEYAVLTEYHEDEGCGCGCEDEECECCDHDHEAYIMKVVPVEDDQEAFLPIEDEALVTRLIDFVQNELYADEEEDDDEEFEEEPEDEE